MYTQAKNMQNIINVILIAIGFIVGIILYVNFRAKNIGLALLFPFIGAFCGFLLSYLFYGSSCAFVYLNDAISKKTKLKPLIVKKIFLISFFSLMLLYFVIVCILDWDNFITHTSSMFSSFIFGAIFMTCTYPILIIFNFASFEYTRSLVLPLYITFIVFILIVLVLYIYSNWRVGNQDTAYQVVTVNMDTGVEVSRKNVSNSFVAMRQNIIGILLLAFSLWTWSIFAIIAVMVRIIVWDYLC